jgi:hypothetical protein
MKDLGLSVQVPDKKNKTSWGPTRTSGRRESNPVLTPQRTTAVSENGRVPCTTSEFFCVSFNGRKEKDLASAARAAHQASENLNGIPQNISRSAQEAGVGEKARVSNEKGRLTHISGRREPNSLLPLHALRRRDNLRKAGVHHVPHPTHYPYPSVG